MPRPAHGQGDVSAIAADARVRQSVLDRQRCTASLEVAHQQNVSHTERMNHRRLPFACSHLTLAAPSHREKQGHCTRKPGQWQVILG